MGVCVSTIDQDQKTRSDAIDLQLEEDGKRLKRECKILLLGSGESGKSTIVKQMKIIHQSGFSQAELEAYRPVVYKNVLDSSHGVLVHMRKRLRMDCKDLRNAVLADKILEYQIPGIKMSSTSHLPSTLAIASRMGIGKAPGLELAKTGRDTERERDEVLLEGEEEAEGGDDEDDDDTDSNRTVKPRKDDSDSDEVTVGWFSPEIAQAIHRVWKDPHFRKVMDDHSSDFYLMDNAR
ncbi:hypothetical protein H0H93_013584 [Arthromyces matolae]|nr:hypothetical protein H0H93_013584 [Arthromyces matolae]